MTNVTLYRKKAALIEIVRTIGDGYEVQNVNNPSDKWIIQGDVFRDTYEPAGVNGRDEVSEPAALPDSFDFGTAVRLLKSGFKVARAGWNGKGMWLGYVDRYEVLDHDYDRYEMLPWIGMKTADNKFVPWLASQTDVLAEDWTVVV